MKNTLSSLATIGLVALLSACGKYHHVEPLKDYEKEEKSFVYGNVGGEPLQAQVNAKETDPKRRNALKSALYDPLWQGKPPINVPLQEMGSADIEIPAVEPTVADTAVADTTATLVADTTESAQ